MGAGAGNRRGPRVRFSLLIRALLAITLLVADQMIDLLRAGGEDKQGVAVLWLVGTSAFAGLAVWYAARTMLRFRVASNPASDPEPRADVMRRFKRGWTNFLDVYKPSADHWAVYENSGSKPKLLERGP